MELLNLFPLEGVHLTLKKLLLTGVSGWNGVSQLLLQVSFFHDLLLVALKILSSTCCKADVLSHASKTPIVRKVPIPGFVSSPAHFFAVVGSRHYFQPTAQLSCGHYGCPSFGELSAVGIVMGTGGLHSHGVLWCSLPFVW